MQNKNYLDENASHLKVDKRLVRQLLDLNDKRIMDFGCGMGGMTLLVCRQLGL